MMLARQGLGLIPDWQFSSDPAINPKINPHVSFPAGVTQTTVQPIGPFWQPAPPQLGGLFDSWAWTNRKPIVIGGVGLLALGLLFGASALLK